MVVVIVFPFLYYAACDDGIANSQNKVTANYLQIIQILKTERRQLWNSIGKDSWWIRAGQRGSLALTLVFSPVISNRCAVAQWCALNGLKLCHRNLEEGHPLGGTAGSTVCHV